MWAGLLLGLGLPHGPVLKESFPCILLMPQPRVEETREGPWGGAGISEPSPEWPQTGSMRGCRVERRGLAGGRNRWHGQEARGC